MIEARRIAVDEPGDLKPGADGGFGDNTPMPAGTPDQERRGQEALPPNFDIVTWPSWEMPSRTRTFLTVRARILRSSARE